LHCGVLVGFWRVWRVFRVGVGLRVLANRAIKTGRGGDDGGAV
jgi:hypothetical protein